MKRRMRKNYWIIVVLVAACLGWPIWERLSGIWKLHHYLSALRSQGEKLDVSELEARGRPGPTNNTVVALLALTNRVNALNGLTSALPPNGRMAAPGRMIAANRLNQWYDGKKATNTWQTVGEQLEQQRDLLEAIDAAIALPDFDFGVDYHGGFELSYYLSFTPVRSDLNLLTAAALYEARKGRLDASKRHLLGAIRLCSHQKNERLIIAQMVRQAFTAISINATWAALQEPGWNDSQLGELLQAWSQVELSSGLQASLEMERNMLLNYSRSLSDSPEGLAALLDQQAFFQNPTGNISWSNWDDWEDLVIASTRPFQKVAWQWVWKEQDTYLAEKKFQFIVEHNRWAIDGGYNAIRKGATRDEGDQDSDEPRNRLVEAWRQFRFPMSGSDSSIGDPLILKCLSVDTRQQMMCAVLACHRYRLATGAWPERLDQLVPKFLPSVPRDRIGGGELSYRLDAVNGFILYSKGSNGIDDGGDSTPKEPGSIFFPVDNAKDLVWPTDATPEEADKVLLKGRF
ncbi:MAG TPA: hypothetical protein VMF06_19310 [Candidatus Limnocylindria bacterium]|nr:hypothetical protein [Candidatus Limnocylindria bacterium]